MDSSSSSGAFVRTPGKGVKLIQAAVAVAAVGAIALSWSWNRWNLLGVIAIAVFAIVSDLKSVATTSSKMKVSGLALGTVLAGARFGPAPAALIALLACAIGWFRWREAPHYLRNNLVTFGWSALAAALCFGAAIRLAQVGSAQAAYYFLVIPAFAVAILVDVVGVVSFQCYLDGTPLVRKLKELMIPILSAELFAAVLTVIAVYFVVQTGAIGLVVLLVTLAIFQYLVGELLTSQHRAQELHRKATTDDLTGLVNRQRFHTLVEEQITASRASTAPFALMLIDLDRFKEINDTLGHHYGDVILRGLGPRLAACAGANAG